MMKFEPLTGCIGAQLHDVDLSRNVDTRIANEIRTALIEHQVLVFPKQELSSAHLVELGSRLGELEPRHPLHDTADGFDNIMVIENGPMRAPDNEEWHADMSFRLHPPQASLLQAMVLPPKGGDTMFASMYAVYEDLSPLMQEFLEKLTAVHSVETGYRKLLDRDPEFEKSRLEALENMNPANSRVTHPVIATHPLSGRKYLNVSESFTSHIVELEDHEGCMLQEMLARRVREPRYQMRHRWSVGDLVIWDNLAAQHFAAGDYAEYRRMHRVTIKTLALKSSTGEAVT